MIPRKRFNKLTQFLFDLNTANDGVFENAIRVKENLCVIYDPSDELINFYCSSYFGVLFLFSKLYRRLSKNKKKLKTKGRVGFLGSWLDFPKRIKRTGKDIYRSQQMEQEIRPFIEREKLLKLHSALSRVFAVIKNVDINSYMEDSTRISRGASTRFDLSKMSEEVGNFLGQSKSVEQAGAPYNKNQKELIDILEGFDNGLKEVLIRFVKFTNRLNVCSLSLFDLYYMKQSDLSYLIIFLWNMQFMEKMTQVDSDSTDLQGKYNFQSLQISSIIRLR